MMKLSVDNYFLSLMIENLYFDLTCLINKPNYMLILSVDKLLNKKIF